MADYPVADRPAHASDVIVFAEETLGKTDAIKHAQRISNALGGQLIVAHVMVPPQRAASLLIRLIGTSASRRPTPGWRAFHARLTLPTATPKCSFLRGAASTKSLPIWPIGKAILRLPSDHAVLGVGD